jgi:hypothetical protein
VKKKRTYLEAMHAIQTGVAMELRKDPSSASPKHLRVGINSMLCNQAALVKVLVAKGLITQEEYATAVVEEANLEVERQEKTLRDDFGIEVNLA